MRLLAALALVALPVLGQTTGVVSLTVADLSGLSYVRPHYSIGVGLERETKRFSFSGGVNWSPSDKDRIRILTPFASPRWNGTASVQALVKLGPALFGGGGTASITRESDYVKEAVRPFVAAGIETPIRSSTFRVLVSHLWPGSDESNHLEGERVSLRLEIPQANWRHRIGVEVAGYRFHQSGNPDVRYSRRTYGITIGEAF